MQTAKIQTLLNYEAMFAYSIDCMFDCKINKAKSKLGMGISTTNLEDTERDTITLYDTIRLISRPDIIA